MSRNNDQQFESIRVVGNLLSSDVLQKIRFFKLEGQSSADYGVEKGLKLNDELSRYWRIAQSRWQEFQQQRQRTDISQHKVAQQDWLVPLLEKVLGYEVETCVRISIGEREFPITHTTHGKTLPMVLCGANNDLDKGDAIFGQEGLKRSPMGLAQEYLNAESDCLWAIVSNGTHLRLLRDNPAMTRSAYIEVDFSRLFDEDNYADFATLWLLLHATRTAPREESPEKCWLELWRTTSLGEGERVVERLRYGVAEALRQLGTGFVAHPKNAVLREQLSSGTLSKEQYFQQVLRLVYRLLFLLTAEDRGIALLPGDEHKTARELYEKGYSLSSLRNRARLKRHYDQHCDAWQQLQINFSGFATGQPLLAQPALGGLFDAVQCEALNGCSLANHYLYSTLFHLGYFEQKGTRTRINYRDMNTEEFGSVYEALLELTPQLHTAGRWSFSFQGDAEGEEAASGNARKISGSYYTPDSLVQELIKSALVPVIEARLHGKVNQQEKRDALLSITVCDPACGSGHFLLGAARRLAAELAQIDADSDQPSDDHYRHALRDVLAHCIFGVDRNPMSVELARVAMWIEGVEPGRALSFLDHHLVCGDALIGITDFKQLEKGIPAAAFKPLSGDDKEVCKQLAKINGSALKDIQKKSVAQEFGQFNIVENDNASLEELQKLEALPDNTAEEIDVKEQAYVNFLQQAQESRLAHGADLLVGAFLLSKNNGLDPVPTSKTLYLELTNDSHNAEHHRELAAARAVCIQARVLHWPLTFPQVFAKGGFDCVLGNPPWERIKLQEEEFFSSRNAYIALAKNKAERSQRIAWLAEGMLGRNLYPEQQHSQAEGLAERRLYDEFIVARRVAEASSVFAHINGDEGGRYPLTGVGDVNTYALFSETINQLIAPLGRAGFIVPTGIATDDSTKKFFQYLVQSKSLESYYGFKNEKFLFPKPVEHTVTFGLLTMLGRNLSSDVMEFCWLVYTVAEMQVTNRRIAITSDEIALVNPNTLTCPVFRSNKDAELTRKIYQNVPVLIREARDEQTEQNPWGIRFMAMFHMSADSHLFEDSNAENRLPLYEGKMMHQFDHRWATYETQDDSRDCILAEKKDVEFAVTPRYWVDQTEVQKRVADRGWEKGWLMGFRDICRATDERTVIAAVIPVAAVGNNMPLIFATDMENPQKYALLVANLSSLVLDFLARHKVGGTHLNFFLVKQLPVLSPEIYSEDNLAFIVPRVLELTYTANDMKPWAQDLGYDGEPFAFDPDRRAILRAELDAYYAKLYGLTRDELRYVLEPADVMGEDYPSETFRVLKNREIKELGEYRTGRLVIHAYDRMTLAAEAGETYASLLMPPPGEKPQAVYSSYGVIHDEVDARLAGLLLRIIQQENTISRQHFNYSITIAEQSIQRPILLGDSSNAEILSTYHNQHGQIFSAERVAGDRIQSILDYFENTGLVRIGQPGAQISFVSSTSIPNGLIFDEEMPVIATILLQAVKNRSGSISVEDAGENLSSSKSA